MAPKGHKVAFSSPGSLGTITGAANVGTGQGQSFRDITGGNTLNFKTIKAGTQIAVTNNADDITIDNSKPENTSVANVGAGIGLVYRDKTIDQINLRSIVAGAGIGIANNANDITLSATATIPTTYKSTIRIPPDLWTNPPFLVSGDPEPASFGWYYFTTGRLGFRALRFKVPVGNPIAANVFVTVPDNLTVANNTVLLTYHWFSDHANIANSVAWKYSMKAFKPPQNPDTSIPGVSTISQSSNGQYLLNWNSVGFGVTPADWVQNTLLAIELVRDFDSHPGNVYLIDANIQIICNL